MTRDKKTHRAATRHKKSSASVFQTIPELRRSFDYIDEFVAHRIQSGVPKEQLVKELQREWLRVFFKRMEKKSATAFIEHQMELSARKRRPLRRHTKRRHRGGVAPFADPITTQPGIYLASGLPPTANGAYPMANGTSSAYGSLPAYLTKGMMAPPEQSILSAPPSSSPSSSPSPSPPLKGGARGRVPRSSHPSKRSAHMGGAIPLVGSALEQMAARPIPSSSPPSNALHDTQTAWYGRTGGVSPDQVQRGPNYQLGTSMFPNLVNVKIDI